MYDLLTNILVSKGIYIYIYTDIYIYIKVLNITAWKDERAPV